MKKILSYVLLNNSTFQMHVVLISENVRLREEEKCSPIDPCKEAANIARTSNKPWRPWRQRGRDDSKRNVDTSHTTILAVAARGPRGDPRSPTHFRTFRSSV